MNVRTWRDLHHPGTYLVPRTAPGATVVGLPGVGKSITCATILSKCYPQVIDHDNFPNAEGTVKQVVWLSVEAPHSGKARDFVDNLMEAWNTAIEQARFQRRSNSTSRRPTSDLNEWLQVAKSGFLGVLHIDEVQNLFQLSSAASRKSSNHKRELRIVEDDLLKWLLNLSNSGQIPVLYSGTPDGLDALAKRFSNAQRSTSMGYHQIPTFNQQSLSAFKNHFLIYLFAYQYTEQQIELTDELASLILELSAGIPRIVIGLWIMIPTGIDVSSLDQTWLTNINSFGTKRGEVAHHSKGTQGSLNPRDEFDTVKALLLGIEKLDRLLMQLRI